MDGDLSSWIGREQVAFDEASAASLKRVAAMLDQPPEQITRGAPTPAGWHAAFFAPLAPQAELAADGHPNKGAFLPPVPYPRRMFAGRRILFHAPIPIGAQLKRISRIASIAEKQGRSGAMVLVQVDHRIEADGVHAIEETHDIIYRPAATSAESAPQQVKAEPREASAREPFLADPTLLFRYSAVTFNAHRIHYDRPYTTAEEGYPDLVVNGGLISLKLCEHVKARALASRLQSFSVRHSAPFFASREGAIASIRVSEGDFSVWATDENGRITADGKAEFAK